MKRFSLFSRSLALTFLALLIAFIPVLAASTTKILSTNYTVVNMSTTTDAIVTASYFKDDGSTWTADPDKTNFTVAQDYGNKVIAQYFDTTLTSGKGSVLLSSSQPLGAVVQIQARNQTATMGAYTGYTTGSNKFYIPLVFRQLNTASGLANTQIMIQNIQGEDIDATVDFYPYPGSGFATFTKTFSGASDIPAYSTKYYDVADESAANLPNGWYGSAVVTAETGKQIAVVVNLFTGNHGLSTLNAFPSESAGTSWAVPQFASRLPNGFSTPISVQNVSGGSIGIGNLDLDCLPASGYVGNINISNTVAVNDKASYAFNPVTDFVNLPTNWVGACKVTASGNVVVSSQLRKPGVTDEISIYEAFRTNISDTKVVVPLVSKRLANGFATPVVIQNLSGSSTAHILLTFTRGDGIVVGNPTYTKTYDILPNENVIINLRLSTEPAGLSMPDGWSGTLVVTTQAAQTPVPVVAYVQLTNVFSPAGDTWMSHQAFNRPEP